MEDGQFKQNLFLADPKSSQWRGLISLVLLILALIALISCESKSPSPEAGGTPAPLTTEAEPKEDEDEDVRIDLIDPTEEEADGPSGLSAVELQFLMEQERLKENELILQQWKRELNKKTRLGHMYLLETSAGPVTALLTKLGGLKKIGDGWMALGAMISAKRADWVIRSAAAQRGKEFAKEYVKTSAYREEVKKFADEIFRKWRRAKARKLNATYQTLYRQTHDLYERARAGSITPKERSYLVSLEAKQKLALRNAIEFRLQAKARLSPTLQRYAQLRVLENAQKRTAQQFRAENEAIIREAHKPSSGWKRIRMGTFGAVTVGAILLSLHGGTSYYALTHGDLDVLLADITKMEATIEGQRTSLEETSKDLGLIVPDPDRELESQANEIVKQSATSSGLVVPEVQEVVDDDFEKEFLDPMSEEYLDLFL